MSIKRWVTQPLEGGVNQTLSALEAGMHVSLIATFDLKTCGVNDTVEEVLARPELQPFDYIPVLEKDSFVGVLNRLSNQEAVGYVREAMQELKEEILISGSASLLSFVENVDNNLYRLVLHGRRIVGIVTSSDLQKFAVRPVLFSLITCVELLLAEWVRQMYPDEKDWLAALSGGRPALIEQRWIEWGEEMAMDKMSVTEFCDKRDAALNLGAFSSKNAARKKLRDIEWLRHAVMHSGDYALTPENARRVARTVRSAREIIQILQDSMA